LLGTLLLLRVEALSATTTWKKALSLLLRLLHPIPACSLLLLRLCLLAKQTSASAYRLIPKEVITLNWLLLLSLLIAEHLQIFLFK
jgi:hypothetical protein